MRARTIVAIVVASHVVGAYLSIGSLLVNAWVTVPGFDWSRDPSYEVLAIAPLSYPFLLLIAFDDPGVGAFEKSLFCFGYIVPAIATAFGLISFVARSRPEGACARCGYDLRATPNRCPECGAVPTPPRGGVER